MIVIIRDHHFYLGGDMINNQSNANERTNDQPTEGANERPNGWWTQWGINVNEQNGCLQINYKNSTKSSNFAFVYDQFWFVEMCLHYIEVEFATLYYKICMLVCDELWFSNFALLSVTFSLDIICAINIMSLEHSFCSMYNIHVRDSIRLGNVYHIETQLFQWMNLVKCLM